MNRSERSRWPKYAKNDLLLIDFWNDGPLVGGCIAGGRRYLHINHKGDVEPCVFCQLSTDNLHEKSLLDVLRTSRLLAAIRKRQPYSDNYLRPCMLIDNPEVMQAVVEEARPRETCQGGALRLVHELKPVLRDYASQWQALADPVWRESYEGLYQKPIADAHTLSANHERRHPPVTKVSVGDGELVDEDELGSCAGWRRVGSVDQPPQGMK